MHTDSRGPAGPSCTGLDMAPTYRSGGGAARSSRRPGPPWWSADLDVVPVPGEGGRVVAGPLRRVVHVVFEHDPDLPVGEGATHGALTMPTGGHPTVAQV